MTRLRDFVGSLTGRIFLLLLIGTSGAALLSLSIADRRQGADIAAFASERTADRIQAYVSLRRRLGAEQARAAAGVRPAPDSVTSLGSEQTLDRLLSDGRLGSLQAAAFLAPVSACARPEALPEERDSQSRAAIRDRAAALGLGPPSCMLVEIRSAQSGTERILVGAPPQVARPRLLDPWFAGVLLLATVLLSFLVARTATRPLRQMAAGAEALGRDLNAPPLPETGPSEIRLAAQAMNGLQRDLATSIASKNHILAAVTHDLQTPMTRMRLRLEKVIDLDLKARLLGDLGAMQSLVREGLDIARDTIADEAWATLDLDSLLRAMADDEMDAGRDVAFVSGCGCDIRTRPLALKRCVSNLVDNAIRYGVRARIRTRETDGGIEVRIDDDGPGVSDDDLTRILQPFVRLETSRSRETGGVGLGLATADRLAREMNAVLTLSNRPQGGLRATLLFPSAAPERHSRKPAPHGGFQD